jgi:hypothetical protein
MNTYVELEGSIGGLFSVMSVMSVMSDDNSLSMYCVSQPNLALVSLLTFLLLLVNRHRIL